MPIGGDPWTTARESGLVLNVVTCGVVRYSARPLFLRRGEVSEWLKEHAWKVCKRLIPASRVRIPPSPPLVVEFVFDEDHSALPYGGPVGPLATIVCKSRQGRKAATVVNDSGAGMWLA